MTALDGSKIPVLIVALALTLAGGTAWAAVTGVVAGTVTDAETGAALSGANVSVAEAGLNTVSDGRGRFVITNVPPGNYTVSVSLVGYIEERITEVAVVQGQVSRVATALEPTVVEAAGAEAKVTAARVAVRRDVTSSVYVTTAADEQMTLSQPNDRYQFAGLVFAQPGVVPDNTFYPHIRGARANQVGYFLDGIPITEPDANVFATNTVSIGLDRLELYTGGYPAEYGGFTGGIINEVVKRGDQMRGSLVDVSAGTPYDFGGMIVETGDVRDRVNWYYGLNAWHSDLLGNSLTTAAPTSSDHIAKIIYDAGARDQVTLLALHGYERYGFPWERMWTFDPDLGAWTGVRPGDDYARQGHDIGGITLNHTLSPSAFWTLRFSRLNRFVELELGDPYNAFWQYRNERMTTAQADYQRQMGRHRLQAGLWQIDSDNNSRYSGYGTEYTPWGLLDSTSKNDTRNTQAYVQDTFEMSDRTTLSLGGRYDKMVYERPVGGDIKGDETSGRAGLTYQLSPRVMLRGSYGQYVEFPRANLIAAQYADNPSAIPFFAQQEGWTWETMLFPDFPVRPQIDRARELGLEWKIDDSTLLSATWFKRDSRQMTQRWQGVLHDADGEWVLDAEGNPIPSFDLADFDEDAPVWFAGNGTGTTRGVEVKADRRMSRGLRAWLAYTYMDAKATSPQDNIYPYGYGFSNRTDPEGLAQEFPVDWSQKHTAALALRYQAGKLTVNPWVLYGSGFPYGQSGLDAGGSDPAHVPNPDPMGPPELVVPENYLDPSDPSKGFIAPNSLKTGKNLTVSLNLSYDLAPGRQMYLQIYNLFGRDDVTSHVIYHPRTLGVIGRIEGDSVYYVPFSRTPPRFFALGIRQEI
jgi:outer membrane receptor protein involved in Fe transport